MAAGLFISFEGSEGCGKTTQIARLKQRLTAQNVPVLVTREPGGTAVGEEIRHLLQFSGASQNIQPAAELLLFAASRAQLVREVIQPALAAGSIVIADRFLDSTTVYQGVARRIEPTAVSATNLFATDSTFPDITFLLDLERAVAKARMTARGAASADRMEQEPDAFYDAVRTGYQQLAAEQPQRIKQIDASRSAGEIAATIWQHLQEKLDGLPTAQSA